MSRGRRSNPMTNNMLGMLGMDGGMDGGMGGDLDSEADLNAELEALLSGQAPPVASRRRNAPAAPRAGPPAGAELSLEAQVAMAMRDVPEDDVDDGDLENDPELMAELQGMIEDENEGGGQSGCAPGLIDERLEQYQMAAAMAESVGDSAKARHCKRAIGTLEELQKRARRGQTIEEAELPPPVSSQPSPGSSQPSPIRETAPPAPKSARPEVSPQAGELPMLTERRDQYKVAALNAKRSGNIPEAKRLVQVAKQFDAVISAIESGQTVDLSNIPPSPAVQTQSNPDPTPAPVQSESRQRSAPASGLTLEEDLRARMEVLQKTQEKAQAEGNSSKARRFGRQLGAYKEAIAACKSGRQYDYSELAVPPGFDPLSASASSSQPANPPPAQAPAPVSAPSDHVVPANPPASPPSAATSGKSLLEDLQERMTIMQQRAQQQEDPSKARRMGRVVNAYKEAIVAAKKGQPYAFSELAVPPGFKPLDDNAGQSSTSATAAHVSGPATRHDDASPGTVTSPGNRPVPGKLQRTLSRSTNQTLVFLQERHKLFKEAALKARNEGKKDLALTYLRQAKGFEPMITAAENGLPVDMSKLPPLPGEKEIDFGFLKAEECESPDDFDTSNPKELYKQLAQKLQAQIQLCKANSSRCSRMGDVSTAAKFDRLTKTSMLDLAALRSSESHGDAVPRFHFEWKTFTMESSNPDLGEDALELQLLRGIDLSVPSGFTPDQMDTYLRAELPFPSSEEPQTFTTDAVRKTNNPEFNATHKFNVNKKQRTFQRLIKSRGVKVEVYYKRGFLKGDKVLGVANVKLADLERKCEIHDSFDLYDGRKAIGGRLEARVRLREPVNGRQVEETREKWLVIDASSRPEPTPSASARTTSATESTESVEVMKYEHSLLVQRMKNLKSQLTPTMTQTLDTKRQELERKISVQDAKLKRGNVDEMRSYVASISKLVPNYNSEARERLKAGDRDKASVLMTKKKLVEKEILALRAKITAK